VAPADPCYHGSPGTAIAEPPVVAAHRPDGTDRAPLTRDYRMAGRGEGHGSRSDASALPLPDSGRTPGSQAPARLHRIPSRDSCGRNHNNRQNIDYRQCVERETALSGYSPGVFGHEPSVKTAGILPPFEDQMMANLPPTPPAVVQRVVSPARSLASHRSRRRWEVQRGNQNSMRHGIFAIVANEVDTATEIALTFAACPSLDGIADLRLVESYALAAVQYRRALAAIDTDGLTSILTSYATRLAALTERLERAVHDRERERQAAMRRGASMVIQLQAKR